MKDMAESLILFVDKGYITRREAIRLFTNAVIQFSEKENE